MSGMARSCVIWKMVWNAEFSKALTLQLAGTALGSGKSIAGRWQRVSQLHCHFMVPSALKF